MIRLSFPRARLRRLACLSSGLAALAMAQLPLAKPAIAADPPGTAHPAIWPRYTYPVPRDPATEAMIADLLRRMTLEEKIGQLVQGDISTVTPDDVRRYHLGSVLNGGNSGPGGDDKAPAAAWLKLADAYWAASVDRSTGGVGIPLIWGIDAIHGHSNIIGATLFPHNVGLGATRDPALIEKIGAATAAEIRVTGQEWTFAPTVTVPQDWRWGRAYEGYSSDPALVATYVGAMLRGLQGAPGDRDLLAHGKVLASTKHFLADGATHDGIDQGDAQIDETTLRDVHGRPYGPAIEGGVATVMASFSSWQGRKMTGNTSLLTGVLKDRMGFGGFVVSDWNAHGQVEGCTNADCPQAILAGVDMLMAPDSWKDIWTNLLAEARAGTIPMARIDDAVARILRVKARLGLFGAGAPSTRLLGGQWAELGSPEHRAIARQAVRESLVMLRNDGVLPLRAGARLLVAGDGADDVARAAGGWTISWQGTGLANADFPGATSLWQGLKDAVGAAGGSAELAPDGRFSKRPDAAIVVFGERPYAEFQGDIKSLQLDPELTAPWQTMQRLKAQGIPVVAVMLTGRPLYVNPALNLADAFVVAWLPGSEGAGLADVLIGDKAGKPRFAMTGRLPTPWPMTARMGDGVLFPLGYGLRYADKHAPWRALPENPGVAATGDTRVWFAGGQPASGWSLRIEGHDGAGSTRVTTVPAAALDGRVQISAVDYRKQEGGRRITVSQGAATIALSAPAPLDLRRQANGDVLLLVTLRVGKAPAKAAIGMDCEGPACRASVPVTLPEGPQWVRYGLPLKCLAAHGADMARASKGLMIDLDGAADIALGEVRLGVDAEQVLLCPQ